MSEAYLPVLVRLQNLSWASLWKWTQLLPGSPPESDGMYLMRCWSTPMQPQTKTIHKIYIGHSGCIWMAKKKNHTQYLIFIISAGRVHKKQENCKKNKAASSLPSLVGSCTPALLQRHNEETHLQCAVFSSLQELNKAIHDPCSGNDFINGWVGFCKRHTVKVDNDENYDSNT